jgi:hypothetical protein
MIGFQCPFHAFDLFKWINMCSYYDEYDRVHGWDDILEATLCSITKQQRGIPLLQQLIATLESDSSFNRRQAHSFDTGETTP